MFHVIAKIRGENNSLKGYIVEYNKLILIVNKKTLWALAKANMVYDVKALSSKGWQLSGVNGFEFKRLLTYDSKRFTSKRHSICVEYLDYKNKDLGIKSIFLVEKSVHGGKEVRRKLL